MSRRVWLALLCPTVAVGLVFFAAKRSKTVRPITPGPDTTVVTGPLDAGGLIDYETVINDKQRGTSTPDTNAVALLVVAIGPKPENAEVKPDFYKWLGISAPPAEGEYLGRSWDYFKEEMRGENPQQFHDHETELRRRPWTAAEEPKYAEWLKSNEKPLAVVAEAVRRPHYFYPLIARTPDGQRTNLVGALLPHVQRLREVAAILSLRVMRRCGSNDHDGAWADVMTLHRLGRHLGKGATLIEMLVGLAIDAIARNSALALLEVARPTAAQARAWRDDFAALPQFPPLAGKLACERFTFLDIVQFIRRDGVETFKLFGLSESKDEPWAAVAASLPRTDWDGVLRTGNGWYDRLAAAARHPTRAARRAAFAETDAELRELKAAGAAVALGTRLVLLMMPAVEKVSEACDRQETNQRTQLLALALAAHRADAGRYPDTLADLAPKYTKDIPADPFTDAPLVYRRTADGYELYSVGPNEKDEGGQLPDDDPRGDDYGVRMPYRKRNEDDLPKEGGLGPNDN